MLRAVMRRIGDFLSAAKETIRAKGPADSSDRQGLFHIHRILRLLLARFQAQAVHNVIFDIAAHPFLALGHIAAAEHLVIQ